MFTSDFFKGNRAHLRSLFTGTAPIVITANGQLQRNGDVTLPFRQDSSFWYLTGIDEPDVVLVIDKTKEYLIVPDRGEWQIASAGAVDHSSLSKVSGIDLVMDEKSGWKQLNQRLKKVKNVATLAAHAPYDELEGFYANPARAHLINQLKAANDTVELLDLRTHLASMRMIKQPIEIEAIQKAIDITIEAFETVQKDLGSYKTEWEIENAMTSVFMKHRVVHAYPPIVASGKHAVTLHSGASNETIDPHDLILFDVGAEYQNYAADITRTYALKPLTKRQQAVFNAVAEVQAFALDQLKPGVTLRECELQVEEFMGEKLRELGLIKAISHEAVRHYYPHGTSHFLGLDTHDVGDYKRPLAPGVVLTVEPGIYIPEEGIGIRIEDNVLITENGIKVLSERLPRGASLT
ncbi:MAG: hypothetical protein JWL85_950 [Candidatus Saccharibacteria bacterium]|nr:hypothetical protein [Candidatus Saccharibacteria bacterium]